METPPQTSTPRPKFQNNKSRFKKREPKNRTRNFKRKGKYHGKNKKIGEVQKSTIVTMFLEILTMIKLYHWKTKSYAEHKTTDELYASLSEKFDKFVEVLLGKDESRINLINNKIQALEYNDKSGFKKQMHEYRAFFVDMERFFDEDGDSDLLSIRDEILADINQFLYLITFDK